MDEKKLLDKLKAVAKDEHFMEELFTTENYVDFASKLKTKDIELSDEEAKALYEGMKVEYGELSEENLDNVTGGSAFLIGACIHIGVVAFLKGLYDGFTSKR